jgi:large subunit ribosomal protein L7Ae
VEKPVYVKFYVPPEIAQLTYEAVKLAHETGRVKRGVREVTRWLEKNRGAILVIIAEDVDPPDLVAHLPFLCEERGVPYIYVPSREVLGRVMDIKQASCAAIVNPGQADNHVYQILVWLEKMNETKQTM